MTGGKNLQVEPAISVSSATNQAENDELTEVEPAEISGVPDAEEETGEQEAESDLETAVEIGTKTEVSEAQEQESQINSRVRSV